MILSENQLRAMNDEPLYWIVRNQEWSDDVSTHSLVGYESNNSDRYRWCSYDDKGKEYVEWDSANADTSTLASSVPSVEKVLANPTPYNQVATILDSLPPAESLRILKYELIYHLSHLNLTTERSLKLLKQLEKFDVEAALELSK